MALINAYNGKNTSGGNTLIDMVDSNNGAFGGATLPVIHPNGYIKFTGGHGFTTGNWGRIVFTANSFQHTAGDDFTILIQYKSANNNQYSMLFWVGDLSAAQAYIRILMSASTTILTNTYDGSILNFTRTFSNSIYNKWNTTIIGNSQTSRYHAHNNILATNTINSTNPLYTATSEPTLGAARTGATYQFDATMYFSRLLHFNHKLSNAEISQYNNQLVGII